MGDYKPYRRIELKNLDPNDEVPAWDLETKKTPLVNNTVNPFDIGKQAGKRGAAESPEGHQAMRMNIDDWQVQEFVWAFLVGTSTTPNHSNLTWELEVENEGEAAQVEEGSIVTGRRSEEIEDSE